MTEKILLVDDEPNVLSAYVRAYRREFDIETALGGQAALDLFDQGNRYAVVVSDLKMPDINGVRVLSEARTTSRNTVRILLTGQADLNEIVAVINEGHIFRFLTKPCSGEVFETALRDGLAQYRLLESERVLLEKTLRGSVSLLMEILSMSHPHIFNRSMRLRGLARAVAQRLNFGRIWEVDVAMLFSQMGCMLLSPEIVEKVNSGTPLTEDELAMYYENLENGSRLVGKIPRLRPVAKAIEFQNKNYDGSGPPEKSKVSGNSIPFPSRVIKVINDYDKLLTRLSPVKALTFMRNSRGKYDPLVLSALAAELKDLGDQVVDKTIQIRELQVDMILAEDITTIQGVVVVPKNTLVTEVLRLRLLEAATRSLLAEPITVKIRLATHTTEESAPVDPGPQPAVEAAVAATEVQSEETNA